MTTELFCQHNTQNHLFCATSVNLQEGNIPEVLAIRKEFQLLMSLQNVWAASQRGRFLKNYDSLNDYENSSRKSRVNS